MSRHALQPLNPTLQVTIGWDPPLRTYFVQVFRPRMHEWKGRGRKQVCKHCAAPIAEISGPCPERDSEEVLWRGFGVAFQDVLTLEEAEQLLEPYATVPPLMHAQLLQDCRWNV